MTYLPKKGTILYWRFKFCKDNYIPSYFETMIHNLFKYDIKLIGYSPLQSKDLLNAKIDPFEAINRSGVYIIYFLKDNKEIIL